MLGTDYPFPLGEVKIVDTWPGKTIQQCPISNAVKVIIILNYEQGGMPWPNTGATQYHAQLGLPDKDRAIKGLVLCNNWEVL